MKLEARSRLVATEVVAAIGDTAPLHSAILEAGRSVQQALEVLSSNPAVATSVMKKACQMIVRGVKMTFSGKGYKIVFIEPTVGPGKSNNSLMGGVSTSVYFPNVKKHLSLAWEFRLLHDSPQDFSVSLVGDVPQTVYKSTVKKGFDLAKYEKIMTRTITELEKNFSAVPKSPIQRQGPTHPAHKDSASSQDAATVFQKILKALEDDNGTNFWVAPPHKAKAIKAINEMIANGCKFSSSEIQEIAGGDQDEAASKFGKFNGYGALSAVLNVIFDGG